MFTQELLEIGSGNNVRNALISIKEQLKTTENVDKLKNTEGYDAGLWLHLLNNEDAKVRKNTALIMGYLNEEGFEDALYDNYVKEGTLFVRSAYLEALYKCNYKKYEKELFEKFKELSSGKHLEEEAKHTYEEMKILKKMFPTEKKHKRHAFIGTNAPVRIVLTAKKDLIPFMLEKVSQSEGFSDAKSIFCGVAATIKDFSVVKKLRVYKEVLLPLNGMKPMTKGEIPDNLIKGNLMPLLNGLHKQSDEPFYFRITAKDLDVATLAGKLEVMSEGKLVNAASDYEVEIKLITGKEDRIIAFLKLHTLNDNRFNYRVQHVAASIHPSNAAIIAELTKEYMKKNATILDPFCGVGTMLIERNKAVIAKHIYGIDTFGKAIEGGRANANLAGANINFINKDYFDFSHEHLFDEIITNFPEFREREDADSFYGRFFAKTENVLRNGGLIIMYSGEKNLVKKHLRLNENYKLIREYVFNEKKEKFVFVIGIDKSLTK